LNVIDDEDVEWSANFNAASVCSNL